MSKLLFLSENPNEFWYRVQLLLQEKRGNDSNRFHDEIVAKIDNLLEYTLFLNAKILSSIYM